MLTGDRLRALRRAKRFSQDEIEERAGLVRSFLSGVENGEMVPNIATLESIAGALEVPLCQLFYDGEEPPALPNLPNRRSADDIALGGSRSVDDLASSSEAGSHGRARSACDSRAGSGVGVKGVGWSVRGKLTPKGVQGMGDHAYNGLNGSAITQGISFHRNWAA